MPGAGFAGRLARELEDLGLEGEPAPIAGSEPYVRSIGTGLVGLALSGGGIRSATFSLGFLRGLADLNLLRLFHYLSTVSGGGYVGGWWAAYRSRPQTGDAMFPSPSNGAPEPGEIRHLREFARFLAPRLSLFDLETGELVLSYLRGLVPSLLLTLALLVSLLVLSDHWLKAIAWKASLERDFGLPIAQAAAFGVTAAALLVSEVAWRRRRKAEPGVVGHWLLIATVTAAAAAVPGWLVQFRPLVGQTEHSPRLALPWLVAAGIFMTAQRLQPWIGTALAKGLERTTARLLFLSLAVATVGLIWFAAEGKEERLGRFAAAAAAGNVTFAATAAWIYSRSRSVLSTALRSPSHLKGWFLTHAVKLLAYAALGSLLVALAVGLLVAREADGGRFRVDFAAPVALFVVGWVLLRERLVLHDFYAGRLANTFIAASRTGRPPYTTPSPKDDLDLGTLPAQRPVHLICGAVNDLAADPLVSLNRGARSATFSRHGFGFGNAFAPWDRNDGVTLSSALAASAAALNSNMGSASKEHGPAATFLACAMNLRLGVWLVHPRAPFNLMAKDLWARGSDKLRVFFQELLGLTRADDSAEQVHVSDGGHFENLGLYELLRRHCRYIVVVDAGMDSHATFEDLGNAFRRAREDFGVEIDLSLDGLRATDGRARQHVAVGEIRYADGDEGVIVYVKPSLTGDEPADVLHYRASHHDFPHESTADQFFDAEQWEAYRRLGEHVARSVFGFVQEVGAPPDAEALFAETRWRWYPTLGELPGNFLSLTEEFDEIEALVWKDAPDDLLHSVYPEASLNGSRDENAGVRLLIQVTQMMEDVWFTSQLDRHGNHPMNQGWLNYFRRWASAPLFRAWWPLLSPCFSLGFRRFMEHRFDLPSTEADARQRLKIASLSSRDVSHGLRDQWKTVDGAEALVGHLELPVRNGAAVSGRLQVAALRFNITGQDAVWNSSDFVVLPSLRWAGLGKAFIERLVQEPPLARCRLRVKVASAQSFGIADRQDRADRIQFYNAAGFRPDSAGPNAPKDGGLVLVCAGKAFQDTSTAPAAVSDPGQNAVEPSAGPATSQDSKPSGRASSWLRRAQALWRQGGE